MASADNHERRASDHRSVAARAGFAHRARRQRAGPAGMPLAWRKPDDPQACRPVARAKALSTYAGSSHARPNCIGPGMACRHRCDPQSGSVATAQATGHLQRPDGGRLLTTAGSIEPGPRRPRTLPERQPDESTIREPAAELGLPQPTLYNWVPAGDLAAARSAPAPVPRSWWTA